MDAWKQFWTNQTQNSELVQMIGRFWGSRSVRERRILLGFIAFLVASLAFVGGKKWWKNHTSSVVTPDRIAEEKIFSYDYEAVRQNLIKLQSLKEKGLSYVDASSFSSFIQKVAGEHGVQASIAEVNDGQDAQTKVRVTWSGNMPSVIALIDDLHTQGITVLETTLDSGNDTGNSGEGTNTGVVASAVMTSVLALDY